MIYEHSTYKEYNIQSLYPDKLSNVTKSQFLLLYILYIFRILSHDVY